MVVPSMADTTLNGDAVNGVVVVVGAAVGVAGAKDALVTTDSLLDASSPQLLMIATAASTATMLQARRNITSS